MRAWTNLAETNFAGYFNVSVHFVFTKLFHQITPYLILGGGTIRDRAAASGAAQNTILRLDIFFTNV